jgi:transposase-like protein
MPVCPRCKDDAELGTLKKSKQGKTCDECGREF